MGPSLHLQKSHSTSPPAKFTVTSCCSPPGDPRAPPDSGPRTPVFVPCAAAPELWCWTDRQTRFHPSRHSRAVYCGDVTWPLCPEPRLVPFVGRGRQPPARLRQEGAPHHGLLLRLPGPTPPTHGHTATGPVTEGTSAMLRKEGPRAGNGWGPSRLGPGIHASTNALGRSGPRKGFIYERAPRQGRLSQEILDVQFPRNQRGLCSDPSGQRAASFLPPLCRPGGCAARPHQSN